MLQCDREHTSIYKHHQHYDRDMIVPTSLCNFLCIAFDVYSTSTYLYIPSQQQITLKKFVISILEYKKKTTIL